MKSYEIRNSFLNYFKKQEHFIVPSAPVIPFDDPTLLFTNAGMNQFKPIFLGVEKSKHKRIADSQKCIRVSGKHNDLEEVGFDTYHHTFFEMLGNWSFGDYYKEEAILWAWELLTKEWKLPKDKLWATVYKNDDEAEKLWKKITDIKSDRILRFGEKENFWEMGETGPCGPCSEIHIDLGEDRCDKKHIKNHICSVNAGCARFIELWNLVFIQFNRDGTGKLNPLPEKHVDTGMGFERIVSVIQNKKSNYDTDVFMPVINGIVEITGKEYSGELAVAHRVIADHIRTLTFAIADGAIPSNEGRGYVLRRILRRASRFGRKLDMHEPFIYKIVSKVVDSMGEFYPEIKEKFQHVSSVIKSEEEGFNKTLDRGLEIFEQIISELNKKEQKVISGAEAFKLYDTYGFPLDLTELMARERGFSVDTKIFEEEMEKQKERSRTYHKYEIKTSKIGEQLEKTKTEFLGYDTLESQSKIIGVNKNEVVLDATPFYAESGGQIGDKGLIFTPNKDTEIKIVDTQKDGEIIIHIGEILKGDPEKVTKERLDVIAHVDEILRNKIMKNHTATHLVHSALRNILGKHVQQSGSLVAPDRLRFDFSHFTKISDKELQDIEDTVNQKIRENIPITHYRSIPYEEAKRMGALAFFGDKYGDKVNVVQYGDFSIEFCGGTHVSNTGLISGFRIVTESSISSGVRRIEAITGSAVDEIVRLERRNIGLIRQLLNAKTEEVVGRIETLFEEKKQLEKEISKLRMQSLDIDSLLKNIEVVNGIKILSAKVNVANQDELKTFGDKLREKMVSGVALLASIIDEKVSLVCVVTDDLIKNKNLKAGDIIKDIAKIVNGGGGGKPHLATAGGKDITKIDEAINEAKNIIKGLIKT